MSRVVLFSKYHLKLQDEKKNFDHFFLILYHSDTWMMLRLIDSVYNLAISGDEIIIIAMISRYFQVCDDIDEKCVKNCCYSLIFCDYFFLELFPLDLSGKHFFFDKRYFRFCFYFISKKWLYRLPTGLLSVMSPVLVLLKKFF